MLVFYEASHDNFWTNLFLAKYRIIQNKTHTEKATWKLYKYATSYFEQILETK